MANPYIKSKPLGRLNLTIEEKEQALSLIQEKLAENRDDLLSLRDSIKKDEDKLFSQLDQMCTPERTLNSKIFLPNLDASSINSNNGVCLINSVLYLPQEGIGSLSQNERIRKYIRIIRERKASLVSSSKGHPKVSSEEYSFDGSFGDGDNSFVIKASRNYNKLWDNVLHEIIIGTYSMNTLRSDVPNFMYVYGGFKCSPPIVDENGKVLSWCGYSREKVYYLVCENLSSQNFHDYVQGCSVVEYLNILLQLVFALRHAHKKLDYTHYNLTTKNVYIRNLPALTSIKYETDQGEQYLQTNRLAIISDYSTSHVKKDDKDIGNPNYISKFIFPRRSFPIADVYRFLYTSLRSISGGNIEVMNVLKRLLAFFSDSSIDSSMTQTSTQGMTDRMTDRMTSDLGETLFYSSRTSQVSLDEFTAYVRSLYPLNFLSNEYTTLYLPETGELQIREGPTTDLIAYYDVHSYITDGRLELDYRPALVRQKAIIRNIIAGINSKKLEIKKHIVELKSIAKKEMLSSRILQKVRNMYVLTVGILDDIETMKVIRRITIEVIETLKKKSQKKDLAALRELEENFQHNSIEDLDHLNRIMLENRAILDRMILHPLYLEAIEKNPNLNWYRVERVRLDTILTDRPLVTTARTEPVSIMKKSVMTAEEVMVTRT